MDRNHLDAGLQLAGEKIAAYHDYRDLINDPNVDIVHIATPPHWHGIMSADAARAGKGYLVREADDAHHRRRQAGKGGCQAERQYFSA
ncbi:MAG: Gfo/Idh/MocA family oxidoreductase [Alistipes indistinctus]